MGGHLWHGMGSGGALETHTFPYLSYSHFQTNPLEFQDCGEVRGGG